jgi:spore coat protein U-like protein
MAQIPANHADNRIVKHKRSGETMMLKSRYLLLAALALAAPSGFAATTTTTFAVTATVVSSCTLLGGVPLAFGVYTPGVEKDASTSFTATCTNGTPYTLALSVGSGSGATFATRLMTSGADTLDYSLYTDAGRTTLWGDGTGGSTTVASTGTGLLQTFTVYGRIPSSAAADIGVYTDTITVTATY